MPLFTKFQIRSLYTSSTSFGSSTTKIVEQSKALVLYNPHLQPFRPNLLLEPYTMELVEYLESILPSRDQQDLVSWYCKIQDMLDTMTDGFVHTTNSSSVSEMVRIGTTNSATKVSIIHLLWVKLGFVENKHGYVISPYANKIEGYDFYNLGFQLRWVEARILITWLYDFIVLYLLGQIKADLNNFDKDSNPYNDLLVVRNDLLRGLSPNVRTALKPVQISLQPRIYSGFDTEFRVIEMGQIQPLSYQLAVGTKVVVNVYNQECLDLNKSMQAIGNEYKVKYQEAFTEASNVNILTNALWELTTMLKPNEHESTLKRLEHLTVCGDLHKALSRKCVTYAELPPVSNKIPDCAKFIGYLDKDTKLSSTMVMEKVWDLGAPLLNNDLENLKTLMGGVSLPPLKANNVMVYLLGHYLAADLCVLSDFKEFKTKMDLLYKSFATLSKPYTVKLGTKHFMHVVFRDTGMLAAAGTSLATLGALYDLNKIVLPEGAIARMDLLLENNKSLFDAYAMRDAEIALIHGLSVEYFNAKFVDGKLIIPTTVASMSKAYIENFRKNRDMPDINRHTEYHVGDFRELFTPKGIQTTGNLASITPMFTGAYRGGRNESFAYGHDLDTMWHDYDLTGAYPTAMSLLGEPDYDNALQIPSSHFIKNRENLNSFKETIINEFIHSDKLYNAYSTFVVKFKFPSTTKYPNLPCHLNKTLTVYPLEGTSETTGFELKVALDNGCVIEEFVNGAIVPFKNTPWVSYSESTGKCSINTIYGIKNNATTALSEQEAWSSAPYFGIVDNLQRERRKYPKKSFNNLFYKLLANAGYGQICIGLASKSLFNSRANRMDKSTPGPLTNPLLACQITGTIRAVLSEALNKADSRNGTSISCTTDGFISNLANLEKDTTFGRGPLTAYFRYGRQILSGCDDLLELKTSSFGVASWCVRGQLGLGPDSKGNDTSMKAMTGFQSKFYTLTDLQKLVKGALTGLTNKNITFMQWSLRSGKDIYMDGGYVTPKLEEKTFRLNFDNRRQILPYDSTSFVSPTNKMVPINTEATNMVPYEKQLTLLGTAPWLNIEKCRTYLTMAKIGKHKYAQHTGYPILGSRYKNYKEIAVRQFVRALLQGFIGDNPFNTYAEIKTFLKKEGGYTMSLAAIANNRRSTRPFLPSTVPRVPSTEQFLNRMKQFIAFDDTIFYQ